MENYRAQPIISPMPGRSQKATEVVNVTEEWMMLSVLLLQDFRLSRVKDDTD